MGTKKAAAKKKVPKPADKLIDVPIRLGSDMGRAIETLAASCGLTPDQMASAMFALAAKSFLASYNGGPKAPDRGRK